MYYNSTILISLQTVTAIATLRKRVGAEDSNYFGGIFFARFDNDKVNTLADIRGKIVETSSILLTGSAHPQWEELRRNNLDLFVDTAQVLTLHPPSFLQLLAPCESAFMVRIRAISPADHLRRRRPDQGRAGRPPRSRRRRVRRRNPAAHNHEGHVSPAAESALFAIVMNYALCSYHTAICADGGMVSTELFSTANKASSGSTAAHLACPSQAAGL
jgi:hypothetical protein